VGLERGPLSLMSTTEELLGRKSSGSCLESREYGSGDLLHWPRDSLYLQKLTLTSLSVKDSRSVGIGRSRSKATEFNFLDNKGPARRYDDLTAICEPIV
jgi:hypothetical protein